LTKSLIIKFLVLKTAISSIAVLA